MKDIKVSVIIPFFSNKKWLNEALESVFNQSYKNIEIILVNDGSKENIEDIIQKYKKGIRYFIKENKGPASARNFGIEKASGEYIAFLDSDDIWISDKVEHQLQYMIENHYIWSHTNYSLFKDITNELIKEVKVKDYEGDVFSLSSLSLPIATPCVMIKTSVLKENPELRFPIEYRFGQDTAFWIKMASIYEIGVVDKNLCLVRVRGSNAALNYRTQIKSRVQIYEVLKKLNSNNQKAHIKLTYRYCEFINSQLNFIENKSINKNYIMTLSKMLYKPAQLLFKLESKKIIYKNKNLKGA